MLSSSSPNDDGGKYFEHDKSTSSVATRFRSSIASLSSSARAAWSEAPSVVGLHEEENSYQDLEGDAAPKSRVDAIEAEQEKGLSRLLKKKPESEAQQEESPAAADSYVRMSDGSVVGGPAAKQPLVSLASTFSHMFNKPKAKQDTIPRARLSAKPYAGDFAPSTSYLEATTTEMAPGGGLWALKAKLVAIEKEIAVAQIASDEARARVADRRETLQDANGRYVRLQRRELFLRELLRHAAELEDEKKNSTRQE